MQSQVSLAFAPYLTDMNASGTKPLSNLGSCSSGESGSPTKNSADGLIHQHCTDGYAAPYMVFVYVSIWVNTCSRVKPAKPSTFNLSLFILIQVICWHIWLLHHSHLSTFKPTEFQAVSGRSLLLSNFNSWWAHFFLQFKVLHLCGNIRTINRSKEDFVCVV